MEIAQKMVLIWGTTEWYWSRWHWKFRGFTKCSVWNLKVVFDGRELIRKLTVYKPIDLHFVTNAVGESISSINKWNIKNKLDENDFSCG